MEHGQKLYAAKTVSWPGATPFCPAASGPNPLRGFWGRARPRYSRSARSFGVLPRTRIQDRARNLQNNADLPYGRPRATSLTPSMQTWAMIVNPFFSPVLRLQTEWGHCVIETGPYKFMRHPGYFAMLIALPASATAIGLWLAILPACGFGAIIMRRTKIEDSFLKRNLPDYRRYANRVPRRLFPSLTPLHATATAGSVLDSLGRR
jgi:Isoprenylcysteine carboxyl methyltransferase (ICMT) family